MKPYHRPYFFDRGIRFACRQCGECCTGAPGVIRVNTDEIEAIAAFVGMSVAEFTAAYLTRCDGGLRIREHPDGRCRFYHGGCRIYPHRPMQCRTWPFWFSNMRSETRWQSVAGECPGIGAGPLVDRDTILERIGESMADAFSVEGV